MAKAKTHINFETGHVSFLDESGKRQQYNMALQPSTTVGLTEHNQNYDKPFLENFDIGDSYQNKVLKLQAVSDYTIKPNSDTNISLRVVGPYNDNERYSFKPNNTYLLTKRLLCVSSAEVFDTLTVRLRSVSNYTVRVFKDTTIGYYECSPQLADSTLERFGSSNEGDTRMVISDFTINPFLKNSDAICLHALLQEYSDVFASTTRQMGRTHLVEHEINLEDKILPIKCKPYRVSQKERDIISKQIQEMLDQGVIRPSHSPWASPIVLVKKKDKTMRFCVDYRKINSATRKSCYPLPNIDDILTYLGGCNYFSTLDMFSGYWQIGIKEEHKPYTAFVAQGQGQFEFNVLSFGLCNAPATFQHLADQVFSGMKWSDIMIYLDDIIIFSKTFEEHLDKLKRVFKRLRDSGLTLNPRKCVLMEEELNILGHTVSKVGIRPDDSKLLAVKNFPRPTSVKHIQSFVGLCSYYRKYIKNFAIFAHPLHEATKKSTGFVWEIEQEEAFQALKEKLSTAPVLHHYNPNMDCELRTDASHAGIGAILLQKDAKNDLHPIAYLSRSLSKAEKNYTISEIEALAVIWSLKYLRHLIYGRHVTIVSDHHALCYLKRIKEATGKLARWAIQLSEYQYTIVHKSGKLHRDVDCLSRYPVLDNSGSKTSDEAEIPTFLTVVENVAELQRRDTDLNMIISILENPISCATPIAVRRRLKNFILIDSILYKKNASPEGHEYLLVVPKSLIHEILDQNHKDPLSAHLGITKTWIKIKNRFYWEGQQKDIEKYIKSCHECQSRKGRSNVKPTGLLQPIPVGTPFERIGIDLLGPFPRSRSGKTVIVVATDYATRWAETKALTDGKAHHVAKFVFEQIIVRHGAPRHILSDRGKVFQSAIFTELLKVMGTKSSFTTSYHPQTNGLTERLNKTLANSLAIYTNSKQTDWDEYLPHVTFAYNTSRQDTTGFSPFRLVYVREPILPSEASLNSPVQNVEITNLQEQALRVRSLAVENIQKSQEKSKVRYNAKHRHIEFQEGDKVRVFTPIRKVGRSDKLLLRYFGPYVVLRRLNDVDYIIQMGTHKNARKDVIHVSRILPYYDSWQETKPDVETQELDDFLQSLKHNSPSYPNLELTLEQTSPPPSIPVVKYTSVELELKHATHNVLPQKQRIGDVVLEKKGDRATYLLVIKQNISDKLNYLNIWKALKNLQTLLAQTAEKRLGIPIMNLKSEAVRWNTILELIKHIFRDSSIALSIYVETVDNAGNPDSN